MQNAEEWHSVRHGDWKLMRHTFKRAGNSFYEYDLYDLSRDPDEVLDRWGSELVVGLTLGQMLESRIARDAQLDLEASASSEIDPQVLDNLRELGYVE